MTMFRGASAVLISLASGKNELPPQPPPTSSTEPRLPRMARFKPNAAETSHLAGSDPIWRSGAGSRVMFVWNIARGDTTGGLWLAAHLALPDASWAAPFAEAAASLAAALALLACATAAALASAALALAFPSMEPVWEPVYRSGVSTGGLLVLLAQLVSGLRTST